MEDSDGGEEEFSIISQSFGLLETLSEVEGVQGRTARIQEYITSVEKEDLPVCPDFETGKRLASRYQVKARNRGARMSIT